MRPNIESITGEGEPKQEKRTDRYRAILQSVQIKSPDISDEDLRLIERQYSRNFTGSEEGYGARWGSLQESSEGLRDQEWIKERLNGEILVDLGGSYARGRDFAKSLGVKSYICVDLGIFHQAVPFDASSPVTTWDAEDEMVTEDERKEMDVVEVKDDILDFLLHLRDGSVNIMMNGIDAHVAHDPDFGSDTAKYHKRLADEILRVTKGGGVILGLGSDALDAIGYRIHDGQLPELSEYALRSGLSLARVFEKNK